MHCSYTRVSGRSLQTFAIQVKCLYIVCGIKTWGNNMTDTIDMGQQEIKDGYVRVIMDMADLDKMGVMGYDFCLLIDDNWNFKHPYPIGGVPYRDLAKIVMDGGIAAIPKIIELWEYYEDNDKNKTVWYPSDRVKAEGLQEELEMEPTGRSMELYEFLS